MTSQAIKFCSRHLITSSQRMPLAAMKPSFSCLGTRSIHFLHPSQTHVPIRCLSAFSDRGRPTSSLASKMLPAGLALGAGGFAFWLHHATTHIVENIPIEKTAFSDDVAKSAKQVMDILEVTLDETECLAKLQQSSLLSPQVLLCVCHEKKFRDKLISLCLFAPQNFLHEMLKKMLGGFDPSQEKTSFVERRIKEVTKNISPSSDEKALGIAFVLVRDLTKALASKVNNEGLKNSKNLSYMDQMFDFLCALPEIYWAKLGKVLVEEGTVVRMCLENDWSTLKKNEDSRVFSLISALMVISGNEKHLLKMFSMHLGGKIDLPARFFREIRFGLTHPYASEDTRKKSQFLASKILSCFPSDKELRAYARKTEDGNIALIVSSMRGYLPKFPANSWEGRFMDMLEKTRVFCGKYGVSFEKRKLIGWSLYLGIPFHQLFRTNGMTSSLQTDIQINPSDWIKFFTSFDDIHICNAAFFTFLPFLTRKDGWTSHKLQDVLLAIDKKFGNCLPLECSVRALGTYLKRISQLQKNLHAGQLTPFEGDHKVCDLFIFNDEMGCSLSPGQEPFLSMMSEAIVKECREKPVEEGINLLKLFCLFYSPGDLMTSTNFLNARLIGKIFETLDEKELQELFVKLRSDNQSLLKIIRAIGHEPNETGCKRFIGHIQAIEDASEKRELLGNLDIATSMFGR